MNMESMFSLSGMFTGPHIPKTTPDQGIFCKGIKHSRVFIPAAKTHGCSERFVIDGAGSCGANMAELSNSERNVPVTPNNDFKCLHKAKSDTLRNKSFHHPQSY